MKLWTAILVASLSLSLVAFNCHLHYVCLDTRGLTTIQGSELQRVLTMMAQLSSNKKKSDRWRHHSIGGKN